MLLHVDNDSLTIVHDFKCDVIKEIIRNILN